MLLVDDIVLDPVEIGENRVELSLSEMGLTVFDADFGENAIEATLIRTGKGQEVVDRRPKPRTVILNIKVAEDDEVDLPIAAYRFQQKLATMQDYGGWFRRDFHFGNFAGGLLYKVTGEITLSGIAGWRRGEASDVTLTMSCDLVAYATEEVETEEPFVTRVNEVTEPSFEAGVSGWTLYEGGAGSGLTLTQTTTSAYVADGEYAGYVNGVNTAGTRRTKYIWDSNPTPVTPGETWYLRAVVSGSPETGEAIQLGYLDSFGTVGQAGLSGINFGITKTGATAGRLMEGLLVVPEGVTSVKLALWSTLIAAGGAKPFVIDAAMLVKVDEPVDFFVGTQRELIYTVPASQGTAKGLRRIRVDNEGTEDWRALIWAEECQDAPEDLEDPTAELAYLARTLTPKGGAEVKSVAGKEVVQHNALTAGWITILSSEIAGVGHMSHQGPRRMWIRAEDPSEELGNVQLQLLYRSLGSTRWEDKLPVVSSPVVGGYQLIDLGLCRPQRAVLGSDRWEWKLLARSTSGAGTIRIRDVYPLPTEQYAVVRAGGGADAPDAAEERPATTAVNDSSIGTRAWTEPSNAKVGDSNYAFAATGGEGAFTSNYLKLTNFGFEVPSDSRILGIVATIKRRRSAAAGAKVLDQSIRLVKDGAIQAVEDKALRELWPIEPEVRRFGGSADRWGNTWTDASVNAEGFGVAIAAELIDLGFGCNAEVDSVTMAVYYAEGADENRICFSLRSIELRPEGAHREHREDDVWGRLVEDGFPPYTPAGGLEELPSRGIVIASQGDLGGLPDSSATSLAAGVIDRPGYLFAREAS